MLYPIFAGSGGRPWLSEASRHSTSSRHFTAQLHIRSIKLMAAAFSLVLNLLTSNWLAPFCLTRAWSFNMLSLRCPVLGCLNRGGDFRGS